MESLERENAQSQSSAGFRDSSINQHRHMLYNRALLLCNLEALSGIGVVGSGS